ncbi:hypothetical protein [Paractinoplanes ferrugineus]|nr:hypothetical protein [Actinoplanes ferrugineus]
MTSAVGRPEPALLSVADLPPGYESADDWSGVVRPGEPDPDVCVDPVAVGSVVNRPAISSYASFFDKRSGILLYEIVLGDGPAKARSLVADVAAAPRRCPVVRLGELALSVERMSVPDLGVRASGVLVKTATVPPTRTRLVVFAAGRSTVVVMAVGVADVGLHAMHTIALTAARKLANRKQPVTIRAMPDMDGT